MTLDAALLNFLRFVKSSYPGFMRMRKKSERGKNNLCKRQIPNPAYIVKIVVARGLSTLRHLSQIV